MAAAIAPPRPAPPGQRSRRPGLRAVPGTSATRSKASASFSASCRPGVMRCVQKIRSGAADKPPVCSSKPADDVGELGAGFDLELAVDAAEVYFHGLDRDKEGLGDLPV